MLMLYLILLIEDKHIFSKKQAGETVNEKENLLYSAISSAYARTCKSGGNFV